MKNEQSNIKKAFYFYNLRGIRFDAYIKTNETSKIPCFYLSVEGFMPFQIMIKEAKYCKENGIKLLDESDLLMLNGVLMSPYRYKSKMKNWEYIVKLWNKYNENKISKKLEMPFYNRLKTNDIVDCEHHTYFETGFNNLDEALEGGFRKGDLVLLASRPSFGKSTLALNIFKNCAIDKNMKGIYFSLDMRAGEIKQRFLAQLSGINIRDITNYTFTRDEYDLISIAREKFSNKLLIDDYLSCLDQIAWNLVGLKIEKGLDFAVVDCLQQIKHNRKFYYEISYILKRIAVKLNITIILLSQLPRSTGDRPKIKDLNDYDTLKKYCDVIMFLYNPDFYRFNGWKKVYKIDIAKTSHGKKKTLNFKFNKNILKFSNNDEIVG